MKQLQLRSYQQRIIDAAREAMKTDKRLIIYAPQASGKSILAAFMALGAVKKHLSVLILTHREEILKQNFHKMNMLGIDVQIINAKTKAIRPAQVHCAMAQTVTSRCKTLPAWVEWLSQIDFVILDEGHRGEHDSLYQYFRDDIWMVGLSASILRSGTMMQLGMIYSKIVAPIFAEELISLRYLTPSKNYAFQAPALDKVAIDHGTGDYVQRQLQQVFMRPERYAGIIENYRRICSGTKALVFTTGAEHCVELCIAFNEAGIRAQYLLSGSFPETDILYSGTRSSVLESLANGDIDVLVSVDMMTTGLDVPSLETVIIDFSTKSYVKYVQCVGRGARIYQNKAHFNVLDFGANISSYGIYEAKPLMSLWHKAGGNGIPLTKECPTTKADTTGKTGCGRLIPISAQDCPFCQYHFSTEREIYEVELQEIIAKDNEDVMSTAAWCAHKKLQGWSTQRILVTIMMKNPDRMRKAFDEARMVLKTEKGELVSEKYYYFLKKNVINKKTKK